MARVPEKNSLILKIQEGELFKFFDTENRERVTVGSQRICDIVIKSPAISSLQALIYKENGLWFVKNMTPEDSRCELLISGKKPKKNPFRLDGELSLRRFGDKKTVIAEIAPVKNISRRHDKKRIDLTERTITVVGSGESCDVRVNNPMVDEKHFFIVYDGGRCFIEDCRSLNGTYVKNKKIKRALLNDYDRISIPSAAYVFFNNKLLFSTSPAGIQIDVMHISKEVPDKYSKNKKIMLVNDVSFRIDAGAFVAIVGGSGAGKSTTLDCINGTRPATDGKIFYDTNDYYENINSYKGVVGNVPQKDVMHEDLTVEDALYYTALLRMRSTMKKQEVMEWVYKAIEDVKLQGKEHIKISSLSGGQKKRVSIAMELLSDPKVIFLDEPTSGLSPDLDLKMMALLKELSNKGRTIVIVTHAMENLDKCDKVAFLGTGGRLCFYGKQAEVFKYFGKNSYSRIFASLTDETVCKTFEERYKSSEYYKELMQSYHKLYGAEKANVRQKADSEKRIKGAKTENAEDSYEEI